MLRCYRNVAWLQGVMPNAYRIIGTISLTAPRSWTTLCMSQTAGEPRGPSATRDFAGSSTDGLVHERGGAVAPLAVCGQPSDSAARRGAERAAVPAPRAQ